ncbi:MAG: MlaE family lipid ABC transporter permease subunit [Deltaproteobacteria bacterium]|nr:MlaE family lipid ABC transporter permease subunit [Deltaproteobacteria bacterium]
MSPSPVTTIERDGRAAVVRLNGDLVVPTANALYSRLRSVSRRRDVKQLVLDFKAVGRLDSSGVAVISLVRKQLKRSGKTLEMTELADHHRAAFDIVPENAGKPAASEAEPGVVERMGGGMLNAVVSARGLWGLIYETGRQTVLVARRKKRLPEGALLMQCARMGVEGVFIVGLLSFLMGMTMAFQGAVQLQRFGAGVFVADMIGMSMVRELAPLMTAIIVTGRTGAAIAAELGTMRVRSEIDALSTMGINPVRFLIVPRILAITLVVPALALMGMFIGIFGGMIVAVLTLDMSMIAFWERIADRVQLHDYIHGLGKSCVFAWIIGFAGSHLGMRAGGDASSVGLATTRTVVASIFTIILVDAVFATVSTLMKHG